MTCVTSARRPIKECMSFIDRAFKGCMRTSCEPWRATSLSGDAVPNRLPGCPPVAQKPHADSDHALRASLQKNTSHNCTRRLVWTILQVWNAKRHRKNAWLCQILPLKMRVYWNAFAITRMHERDQHD